MQSNEQMAATADLQIKLCGPPQIMRCGQPVTEFISDKARALFYYLVITGEPHTRSALAALCWADRPEQDALRNLRRALHNLQQLFSPHLAVDRQTIAFQPEPLAAVMVDLWQLLACFDGPPAAQSAALAQIKGTLLEGFHVADAPLFDDWLHESRATLQTEMVETAQRLLQEADLAPPQAIELLHHLVAHEPWNEVMQRRLLTLLAHQGAYAAAQAQYATLQNYLTSELGIPPEPATTLLVERIHRAQARGNAHLPQPTTKLVGRCTELAQISRLLMETGSEGGKAEPPQLVTLTGPGGSGKTRLALAVAHTTAQRFLDGVWWVSLAGTSTPEEAAVAIARTIGLDLQGTAAVADQIVQAVHGWDALLVLDNSEQLLSPVFRAFVLQLLEKRPTLRLLLTSRERLHLQQEQVIALVGLQAVAEVEALFIAQARQVQPTFTPDATERAAIREIGGLVDGLPLALTLAAALVTTHSCTTILSTLQQSLDALTEVEAALPEHQQSLRAVFNHSWQLLSPQEQMTLAALAHFPGDFSLEAAQAVITPLTAAPSSDSSIAAATTSMTTLLRALVHKSLLQPHPSRGRYALHDVLRGYAAEKLHAEPALAQTVGQAYNRYFIGFMQSRRDALLHADSVTIATITTEFMHLRHVWQWACATRQGEVLLGLSREMSFYLDVAARYREGKALFQAALATLEQLPPPLNRSQQFFRSGLLLGYSNLLERLGDYTTAQLAATEALGIGEALDEDEPIHFALLLLGRIALAQGAYATAADWLTQGAAVCAQRSLSAPQARILLRLGEAQLAQGEVATATLTFQQALTLATSVSEQRAQLYCHVGLGGCALAQRDPQRAQHHWQGALEQAKALQVPALLAEIQVRIAGGLLMAGRQEPAAALLHAALPHLADQTHGTLFATAVRHLAWLAIEQGRWTESELLLQRATQLTEQNNALPQQLATLLLWARYCCAQDNHLEAMPLLQMVRSHPAATWAEKQLAGALLAATDQADDGIIAKEAAVATGAVAALLSARFDAAAAHAADGILLPLLNPTSSN